MRRTERSTETFTNHIDVARPKKGRRLHRTLGVMGVAGIVGFGVGAARHHYFGIVSNTDNDDTFSVSLKVPNIPTIDATVVPRLDTSDHTNLIHTLRTAARQENGAWCSLPRMLAEDGPAEVVRVCIDDMTILMDELKNDESLGVVGVMRPEGSDSMLLDPTSLYFTLAKKPKLCHEIVDDIQTAYQSSVQTYTGVTMQSVPELRIIISAAAEEVAPGLTCDTLCLPLSPDCNSRQTPSATEGTTYGS